MHFARLYSTTWSLSKSYRVSHWCLFTRNEVNKKRHKSIGTKRYKTAVRLYLYDDEWAVKWEEERLHITASCFQDEMPDLWPCNRNQRVMGSERAYQLTAQGQHWARGSWSSCASVWNSPVCSPAVNTKLPFWALLRAKPHGLHYDISLLASAFASHKRVLGPN